MLQKRKVVVTGLGVLAPNGNTTSEYWKALTAGKSGIGPIESFDASDLSVRIAGELKDFDPQSFFDRKELRKLDPFTIYHLVSSEEAIKNSGIDLDKTDGDRIGVIIGTGIGGIQTLENEHGVFSERGQRRVSLSLFLDLFLILHLEILPSNLGSEVLIIRLFLLVHLVLMLLVAQ